ncbi:hypothetical protein PsalN5692_00662 [Piscirickettsia salmonis]|uniref:copper chaperone PCu(A)C n=1 Tax=Piscirickettsia salmonis TaxID=1238 RepID=UPI0012B96D16|nr:copper chaperone PCu(A)C [Piscirickettsia salmonis]QGP49239.1 hypothetical protein PsalN5692_00662 [Piscirickettsia salmonis]
MPCTPWLAAIAVCITLPISFANTPQDYQPALKQQGQVAAQVITITKAHIISNKLKIHDNAIISAVINNHSSQSHDIIAAYSPVAQIIQLHKTHDQPSTMKQLDHISLGPHESLTLNKDQYHIMLINLKQALTNQEKIPLFVEFKDGSWLKTLVS